MAPKKKGDRSEMSADKWKPTAAVARHPPLLEACLGRRAADALKLVDDAGEGLNAADEHGYTPLIYAAFNDKFEAVAAKIVDAAGVKLNAKSSVGGSTALIFACERGRAATAQLLVDRGAKLDIVGAGGKTALDYADEKGLAAVAAAIRAKGGKTGAEVGPQQPSKKEE